MCFSVHDACRALPHLDRLGRLGLRDRDPEQHCNITTVSLTQPTVHHGSVIFLTKDRDQPELPQPGLVVAVIV